MGKFQKENRIMKANNYMIEAANKPKSFSAFISGKTMQSTIQTALGTPARAASFTSNLISVRSATPQLQNCGMDSIVTAALMGESMNLSLPLGQYAIVPYGDKARFQITAKGLAQMAMRTNEYVDIDVLDVREGEYIGRNQRTRQPLFQWVEDDDQRESLPLSGFYAFFELKNGFFKSLYWTYEKILRHADRYSKAFNYEKYKALLNGDLSPKESEKLRNGTPWYDVPDSEAHQKMCKKTLLIQLLNSGFAPMSSEMISAIHADTEPDSESVGDWFDNPSNSSSTASDTSSNSASTAIDNDTTKANETNIAHQDAPNNENKPSEELMDNFFENEDNDK